VLRFHQLDLNLLVALDALLSQANVSRAAKQCNLTQSAMSGALKRLRDHFQDELLVQVGRTMVLTTLAQNLVAPIRGLLLQAQSIAVTRAHFDPAVSERQFVIMASDYVATVVLADLTRYLAKHAPRVSVLVRTLTDDDTREDFDDGKVDFVILPERYLSARHPRETLYEDDWTCIAWNKNKQVGRDITLERYLLLGHVQAVLRQGGIVFDDSFILRLGHARKIAAVVPSFTLMPEFVVGTNLIATMHTRMARIFARRMPLKLFAPPVEIPPVSMSLQWHKSLDRDPSSLWLRTAIRRIVRA
jgi:LysR family transcriptional regulator, nod-box dependent transcriptional activator